ncbi:hypothetical protein LCGC14_2797210, partial [marine sediment metagenome]
FNGRGPRFLQFVHRLLHGCGHLLSSLSRNSLGLSLGKVFRNRNHNPQNPSVPFLRLNIFI